MIAEIPSWERRLLEMAREGIDRHHAYSDPTPVASDALMEGYRNAEEITKVHSRSFHFASRFLPDHKRRGIRALYAFCRITDDIVDEPGKDVSAALKDWRTLIFSGESDPSDPVVLAWQDTRHRFQIPQTYVAQLIDGVGRDLQQTRYESFESLSEYCYGVASTVGLMSMHIIGYQHPEALRYAVKMGVALQLTNILRDVGADLQLGRVYLPRAELRRFDLDEEDLASGRISDRWREFMGFQIARVRRLYQQALPGIALLHRDGRFAVTAAAELYSGILGEIENNNYDVFARRAHLSTGQKLLGLPSIWLRSRFPAPALARV
jgi:phytoene synthase